MFALAFMFLGMALGFLLRACPLPGLVSRLVMPFILALLFCMGALIGGNESLMASLPALGARGLALAALLPRPAWGAESPLVLFGASYPACLAAETLVDGMPDFVLAGMASTLSGCPHDYALTPQDRERLESADLVLLVGGDFETFLDRGLLADLGERALALGEGPGAASNPHVFSSPRLFSGMVSRLAGRLRELAPGRAAELERRAQAFAREAVARCGELAAREDGEARVVLQHDTLVPFFSETGLAVEAVLQEEDEALSPARLLALASRARERGRWLLVGEPQRSPAPLELLAAETGARLLVLDPLASGPAEMAQDRYLEAMRQNLELLRAALA